MKNHLIWLNNPQNHFLNEKSLEILVLLVFLSKIIKINRKMVYFINMGEIIFIDL